MDPYQTLGIPRDATEEQIKQAYRKKAFEFHPDRNPGKEEEFKRVQAAYEALQKSPQQDPFGNFEDLFNSFFGFRQGKPRGRDIFTTHSIEFMEAAKGCEIKVSLRSGEICTNCRGEGGTFTTCNVCNGSGMTAYQQGHITVRTNCKACINGKKMSKVCSDCGGEGVAKGMETVSLQLPAGVRDGDRFRLAGRGERKGHPGDAYVIIKVNPHKLFTREDDDIVYDFPISFAQAVLGATIKIPTLEGFQEVTITPKTCDGEEIRLGGLGLANPQTRRRGDCVARLKIDVEMPDEAMGLIRELNKFTGLKQEQFSSMTQP